jgi:hypothetical protein
MSLVTTVYVPEGIVISTDSRILININTKNNEVVERASYILSDTIKKVKLIDYRFGIAAYGQVSLKSLPIIEHLEAFEAEYITEETQVSDLPQKLIEYFTKKFGEVNTIFYVAGYQSENNLQIPHIYLVDIRQKIVNRLNKTNNDLMYSASWGGETDMLTRMFSQIQVKGRGDEWVLMERGTVHYEFMSLEDAIIFSRYLIEVSEKMFKYQLKQQSVGGKIATLVIPRHDFPYYIDEE